VARERARINLIVDRLIEKLEEIDGDETEWLTAPRTVRRFRGTDDLDVAMPAILIRLMPGTTGNVMGSSAGGEWRTEREIILCALTKDTDDPQAEVSDLGADVRKALRALGGTLLADDGTTQLAFGVKETANDMEIDPDLAGAGFAADIVTVSLTYQTTADNP